MVKCERSDKQTAAAASRSGANECVLRVSTVFIHQSLPMSVACLAYDSDIDQIHRRIMRALDKREEMKRWISVITDRHKGLEFNCIKCNFSLQKENK